MSDPLSITVSRDLLDELKPIICCTESGQTCSDNDFCTSNPRQWPNIQNGIRMTRIAYGNGSSDESVPGPALLCSAYMDWYVEDGCAGLTEELAAIIDGAKGSNKALSKEERALAKSLEEKISERCGIIYVDERGKKKFNKKRADDLEKLRKFCVEVTETEKKNINWWDFFKGGGAVGVVLLLLWVASKIFQIIRNAKDVAKDVEAAVTNAGPALEKISKGTKRLFAVSIPDLAKTMKYVVTFGWLRGKPAPPETVPVEETSKTNPEAPALPAESKVIENKGAHVEILPDPSVVKLQIAALEENKGLLDNVRRFNSLSDTAKQYIAHVAIKIWTNESAQKKAGYINGEVTLNDGRLPVRFLARILRHQLNSDSVIEVVEASAAVWAGNGESGLLKPGEVRPESDFQPRLLTIRKQLVGDSKIAKLNPAIQNYIANLAMLMWGSTLPERRQNFITPSDSPKGGALPHAFMRLFRKTYLTDVRTLSERAELYGRLVEKRSDIADQPLLLMDKRLKQILMAWNIITKRVQGEFLKLSEDVNKTSPPINFAEYIFKVINVSVSTRTQAGVSNEPWEYETSAIVFHRRIDVRPVMLRLSKLNPQIKFYPEVLVLRASLVVDAWLALHEDIKQEFIIQEIENKGSAPHIGPIPDVPPDVFVEFIHRINSGIGTSERPPTREADKGGGKPPEGGSGTPHQLTPIGFDISKTDEMDRNPFEAAAYAHEETTPSPSCDYRSTIMPAEQAILDSQAMAVMEIQAGFALNFLNASIMMPVL